MHRVQMSTCIPWLTTLYGNKDINCGVVQSDSESDSDDSVLSAESPRRHTGATKTDVATGYVSNTDGTDGEALATAYATISCPT